MSCYLSHSRGDQFLSGRKLSRNRFMAKIRSQILLGDPEKKYPGLIKRKTQNRKLREIFKNEICLDYQ